MKEERTQRERARELLARLLPIGDRVVIRNILDEAHRQGISTRTMQRASTDLGVVEIHNGALPAFWTRGEARSSSQPVPPRPDIEVEPINLKEAKARLAAAVQSFDEEVTRGIGS
jgi:alkyl hydroperoxide reductase subunit AhpC